MCGIAGIYFKQLDHPDLPSKTRIERFTNELLRGIEIRGRDATGVVSISDGARVATLEKSDIPVSRFINWRRPLVERPRIVMLHTRFATKGRPENPSNNHPVQYGSCYAIHNGHISNDDDLFTKHSLERQAEVDTEIIPALFDKFGIDKAHLALQELDGNFAVAVADPERFPNALVLAKGPSSPLEYIENDVSIVWASSRMAIDDAFNSVFGFKPAYKDYQSVKYGQLLLVEDGQVDTLDFEVFKRPVRKWSTNDWSRDREDDWSMPPMRSTTSKFTLPSTERRKKCVCGEIRFMHGGDYYDGPCLMARTNCEKFRSAEKEEEKKEGGYNSREFTVIEGGTEKTWVVCVGCSAAVRKEEANYIYEYPFCDMCDDGTESDKGTEDDVPREDDADDEEIDEATVLTANELGLYPEYVNWLLTEAIDEDFDRDMNLINSYCLCDDLRGKYARQLAQAEATPQLSIPEDTAEDVAEDGCGVRHIAD